MVDYKQQGKLNRKHGAEFERATRKHLLKKGFTVDKWTNNVDLEKQEIVPAKSNPFNRFNKSGSGFPDFLAFYKSSKSGSNQYYSLIFVECKINKELSRLEKEKMNFLMKEGFNCWVAYKGYKMSEVLMERLTPFVLKKIKKKDETG